MMSRLVARSLRAALLCLGLLVAMPAWACGGFFCFTQPVDQSAERILYVHEAGKITLHVQISYKGDDQNFSWVLPLTKAPEKTAEGKDIAVGSDTIFQMLEQYTSPSFQLNWKGGAECQAPFCLYAATGGGPPNADGGSGVKVLAQDSVGPYDYALLQGTSGDAIVKWLNDNKFVQPASTSPLVQSYAQKDYVFLALKLKKDKGAGDLVPVSLTVAEDSPCLPIRLTALATQPDMPIVAWVIDKARAIPKNYLHVELNDASVDWFTGGGNYKTVVSKAVDQGSGHAFLTEYAKKTSEAPIQFAQPGWDVAKLAGLTDPAKFLAAMFQMQLPRTVQMQNLIKKYIKKPDTYKDISDQQFYGCIQNYDVSSPDSACKAYFDAAVAAGFDGAAFAKDLDQLVIQPLKVLDKQYQGGGWLTRLYTTLSAEEMTKDPIFAVNADLPAVSNLHVADATPICEAGSKNATSAKITFADGFELTLPIAKDQQGCMNGPGAGGPINLGSGTGPLVAGGGQPLAKLQVLDESGPPLAIDQSVADKVDAELNKATLGKPSLSADFKAKLPVVKWDPHSSTAVATGGADAKGSADTTAAPAASSSSPSSSSCSSGTVGFPGALAGLVAAVALLIRRRRAA
ncbi:MAG: DUF2330 domain-containing protein [Deltaproteobacteria bacterium]|nr:DUF2330 domain-containing protein [Deltaproteobacteria bacterium]